ncbi:MAG: hypothetical protein ABI051_04045 [Vicinamibacterales bacterium]
MMIQRALIVCVAALLGTGISMAPVATAEQEVSRDVVLSRVADYANRFTDRFANMVAEERYEQMVKTYSGAITQDRILRSDLLLVKDQTALGWISVRDVFEVNGQRVRDHQERLTALFTQPAATAAAQALRLAEESARYNIGPGARTTNTPELAILFLQRGLQPRFVFTLGGRAGTFGDRVWTMDYQERARPTLIRRSDEGDLPASGRVWIDVDTGAVMQTTLTLDPPRGHWLLTTKFRRGTDDGIALPAEMTERFELGTTVVVGTASYGRFRLFDVTTEEAAPRAAPAESGRTR